MEVDFQDIPELQQFVVANVQPTGTQLGKGAYGCVEEVEIPGATCAAKRIHEILLREASADAVRNITDKFVRECQLMSSLHHPHIVQFLGVCFLPGSRLPALLMERLMTSLGDLLDDNPNISLATKRSILHDVARGLAYLHSRVPPIIHRDLTAKNVLLNSAMVAKVADLGVARIVDIQPGQLAATMTQTPGTAVYMPPEALEPNARYDTTIDIFSFGNLALYTLTQIFPQLKAPTYIDSDGNFVGRTETERRIDYIQQIQQQLGHQHPMVLMIGRCLLNNPRQRPTVNHILQELEGVKGQIPDHYGRMTRLEMETVLGEKEDEVGSLQQRVECQQHQIQSKEQELQSKDQELQTKDQELLSKDQELLSKDQELLSKDQELLSKNQELQTKDHELLSKDQELLSKDQELLSKDQVVQANDQELRAKNHELQQRNRKLELNDRKLQYKHQQLQSQLEEIRSLRSDINEKVAQVVRLKQQLKTGEVHHEQSQELQLEQHCQVLEELPRKAIEPEPRVQEMLSFIKQLPQAFVTRFTAEELPPHMRKHIEDDIQEWEENLFKFCLFCEHPRSGSISEKTLEVHKNQTLGEATERAYKVLELHESGVKLEQCELVRYNKLTGTLGKPFDEPKVKPLGEVVGGTESCLSFDLLMEIQTDPTTLPRHEQKLRASRVILTNFGLLWYHLNTNSVLPLLLDKSILSESQKKEVESYQQRCGQNAVAIHALFSAEHSLEGLLTICSTLQAMPGKEHIARHILRDYRQQSSVSMPHTPVVTSVPLVSDLSEASLQFQNLQQAVGDLLVQCPNALTKLKQCLASLVLPLGDGKVVPLVNSASYEAARTIPELFTMMAPYWNCLSPKLFFLLLEASGCQPAATKLAEFENARTCCGSLVLCAHRASRGELRSVRTSSLDQLQLLHQPVFAQLPECKAASDQNTVRISAEVDTAVLHVACYEKVTSALCGFFKLPDVALVFAGCSEDPLTISWLVSADLLPCMISHAGGLSGERLLAKQKIAQFVIGDAGFYKCLNLKEVELLEASFYGLLERIPDLLTSVSIDAAGYDDHTPLWTASFSGHQKVVDILLAAGANPDLQGTDGSAALHVACQEGHVRVAEMLLQAGASLEQETMDGRTALYIASSNGHEQIVEQLLMREADVNHQKKDGFAALHVVCREGHVHVAEMLLQAGASLEQETKDGRTALYIASSNGHKQIVEQLLMREADVNHQKKDGCTPLWTASFRGHQKVVEILLAAGANPDLQKTDGFAALHVACQKGHVHVAEMLLQAGASLEQEKKDGSAALHVACQEGHVRVAEMLLQAGASLEQETKDGRTALYVASSNGHEQIVEQLLVREADVNYQRKDGFAALHVACREGHVHVAEMLLQAGASLEQETKDGCTPLWTASFRGHQKVVEILLAAGANPDLQKTRGTTPVMIARSNGHQHIVQLLLEASRQRTAAERPASVTPATSTTSTRSATNTLSRIFKFWKPKEH